MIYCKVAVSSYSISCFFAFNTAPINMADFKELLRANSQINTTTKRANIDIDIIQCTSKKTIAELFQDID